LIDCFDENPSGHGGDSPRLSFVSAGRKGPGRASAVRAIFWFGFLSLFIEDLLHLHVEVFDDFAGEFEMALMCGCLWRFARWFFFLELSKVLGMSHLVWNLTSV